MRFFFVCKRDNYNVRKSICFNKKEIEVVGVFSSYANSLKKILDIGGRVYLFKTEDFAVDDGDLLFVAYSYSTSTIKFELCEPVKDNIRPLIAKYQEFISNSPKQGELEYNFNLLALQ